MMILFRRRARALRLAADAARDGSQWAQAAALYQRYLSKWPNGRNAAIWIQLGNAAKEAGLHDRALAAYQRAIALKPADAEAHVQLGHLHKRMGAPGESRAAYVRAVQLDPASSAAAELGPPKAAAVPPAGDRAAADQERDSGQWALAAQSYERHLAQHAGDAAIWVQLGHMRKEAGDNDAALAAYRQAIALDSNAADSHLQLGHLLKTMGAAGPARSSYMRALQLDPGMDTARAEVAALGAGSDDRGPAMPGWGPAVPLAPDRVLTDPIPTAHAVLSRRFR